MKELSNKKTPVIILGCGRSGTSLLTSLIIKNYEFTGKNPISTMNKYNPHGYFEDIDINNLNDQIISESGLALPLEENSIRYGGWLSKCNSDTVWKASADSIKEIKKHTEKKLFCYKDPRFSYTFPIWREIISKDVKFLVAVRQPGKNANSIVDFPSSRELNLTFEDALEIWHAMYSNILKYAGNNFLYIHYEDLVAKKLERIEKFLGIKADGAMIDAKLDVEPEALVSDKYGELYKQLCKLAEFDFKK